MVNSRIKELAPQILEEIKKANKILLSCHLDPDGDSLGSSLAMYHYLKGLGKEVRIIIGDSRKPEYLSILPGYELIEGKNYFEVNTFEVDLYLIIDTASIERVSKKSEVNFPENLTTVVIDHHPTNPGFGQINLIVPEYIAACEIVYDLFKEWGVEISTEMAACLYIGMYTDSGGFKFQNVSAHTYSAAAELVSIYPDFWKLLFEMENQRNPSDLIFQGLAFSSLKSFFNSKVTVSQVSYKELKAAGLIPEEIDSGSVANLIKSVKGWEVGVAMTEKQEGEYKLSFRTRDAGKYDLTKVSTLLEGGGHKAAAGGLIKAKSKDQALEKLTNALKQAYPDLGTP